MKLVKTKIPGIRYREHPTRKHGVGPDRYYMIRYRVEGIAKQEGLGWASQGWTLARAGETLSELKRNIRTGEGEKTLAEKREKAAAERQAELERQQAEQEARERERLEFLPMTTIFYERYLPYARDNKKERTCNNEEYLFRDWIKPVVGKKPLKEINAFDGERIKKRLRDYEKSDRTIEYTLAVLRQIFSYARKFKIYVGENPVLDITKPKYDNRKQRFLTLDESKRLLDALKEKSNTVFLMALISLYAGLRLGEITNLTWGDVDFQNGLLMLRDTKNSETRYGFMTEFLKKELMALEPGKTSDYIFKDKRHGGKIRFLATTFGKVVQNLGLNSGITDRRMKITFHSLRHTFASNCVAVGVDLFRVQKLLGHKTGTMTQRYSHLRANDLREAVRLMEKAMNVKEAEVIPMNHTD